MSVIKMSSDEARSKWREVIDSAIAGNQIVIERYGKPVVAVVAHSEFAQTFASSDTVREKTAAYQTDTWERKKAELIQEIKAELLADPAWREALLQMTQNAWTHLEEEFADYEQRYPKTNVRN